MGVLGALTDMQRLNALDEARGVQSIKGLFDNIRQRDLGRKFFTMGDYSPEALQRFSSENNLSPTEMKNFLLLAKDFTQQNRDKIRFDREGQKFDVFMNKAKRDEENAATLSDIKKKLGEKINSGKTLTPEDQELFMLSGGKSLGVPSVLQQTLLKQNLENAKLNRDLTKNKLETLKRKRQGIYDPVEQKKIDKEMKLLEAQTAAANAKVKAAEAQIAKINNTGGLTNKDRLQAAKQAEKLYNILYIDPVSGEIKPNAPDLNTFRDNYVRDVFGQRQQNTGQPDLTMPQEEMNKYVQNTLLPKSKKYQDQAIATIASKPGGAKLAQQIAKKLEEAKWKAKQKPPSKKDVSRLKHAANRGHREREIPKDRSATVLGGVINKAPIDYSVVNTNPTSSDVISRALGQSTRSPGVSLFHQTEKKKPRKFF